MSYFRRINYVIIFVIIRIDGWVEKMDMNYLRWKVIEEVLKGPISDDALSKRISRSVLR